MRQTSIRIPLASFSLRFSSPGDKLNNSRPANRRWRREIKCAFKWISIFYTSIIVIISLLSGTLFILLLIQRDNITPCKWRVNVAGGPVHAAFRKGKFKLWKRSERGATTKRLWCDTVVIELICRRFSTTTPNARSSCRWAVVVRML